MVWYRRLLVALAITLLVALAGCANNDANPFSGAGTPTLPAPPRATTDPEVLTMEAELFEMMEERSRDPSFQMTATAEASE